MKTDYFVLKPSGSQPSFLPEGKDQAFMLFCNFGIW